MVMQMGTEGAFLSRTPLGPWDCRGTLWLQGNGLLKSRLIWKLLFLPQKGLRPFLPHCEEFALSTYVLFPGSCVNLVLARLLLPPGGESRVSVQKSQPNTTSAPWYPNESRTGFSWYFWWARHPRGAHSQKENQENMQMSRMPNPQAK